MPKENAKKLACAHKAKQHFGVPYVHVNVWSVAAQRREVCKPIKLYFTYIFRPYHLDEIIDRLGLSVEEVECTVS